MKHPAKNSSRNFRCCRTFCTDEHFLVSVEIFSLIFFTKMTKIRERVLVFFAVTSLFTREIVEK